MTYTLYCLEKVVTWILDKAKKNSQLLRTEAWSGHHSSTVDKLAVKTSPVKVQGPHSSLQLNPQFNGWLNTDERSGSASNFVDSQQGSFITPFVTLDSCLVIAL